MSSDIEHFYVERGDPLLPLLPDGGGWEHDGEEQKEGEAHGQQQRDAPDFPPWTPFLHIIGLVQRRRDGHHGTGGGPQCGQNPEGQQPAFLLRHELPDIVLEEL